MQVDVDADLRELVLDHDRGLLVDLGAGLDG